MNTNQTPPMGTIPGLDRPVSRLFFGTANPPLSTDEPSAPDLLDKIADCGINAFDCARSSEKHGEFVPEIAMRYFFCTQMNVFAIVNTASPERMRMNIRAAASPLPPEEVRYLETGSFC